MPGRVLTSKPRSSLTVDGGSMLIIMPSITAGCAISRTDDGLNDEAAAGSTITRPETRIGFVATS